MINLGYKKLPTVVVTGPAGSGKTSLCQILSEIYKNEICYLPETATTLVEHASISIPKDDAFHLEFQKSLYSIQDIFEKLIQNKAQEQGKKIVLLDRGTVDMGAYIRIPQKSFFEMMATNLKEEYKRYDYCIYLSPVASQEVYEIAKPKNLARYESYEQMLQTAKSLENLWKDHKQFISIKNEKNFSRTALKAIDQLALIIGKQKTACV